MMTEWAKGRDMWKHLKSGGLYRVLADPGYIEETLEHVVVYQCCKDGRVWVRPFNEFHDGRFENCGATGG